MIILHKVKIIIIKIPYIQDLLCKLNGSQNKSLVKMVFNIDFTYRTQNFSLPTDRETNP